MNATIPNPRLRSVAWFGFALIGFLLVYPGCSSDQSLECDDDVECESGERCVARACRTECEKASDCSEEAVCSVWRFRDGSEASVCSVLSGRYTGCDGDSECDGAAGFFCVGELCRTRCRSHDDCSSVGHCAPFATGEYCVPGVPTLRGRPGAPCPLGTSDCNVDQGFFCLGDGPGDLDALCTADCTDDDDCPVGSRCGSLRTSPCGPACGVAGDPERPDCAPLNEIGEGRRYQCGALGAIRRVCQPRSFCSPCQRDQDCLGISGQVCARDESGERICTVPCDSTADSCPWGNAAKCGNFDTDRGVTTCSHRFGSCRGTGNGCEPCIEDQDCDGGVCSVFGFSGERFCIDLSQRCDCGADLNPGEVCAGHGCPPAPSGLEMFCLKSRSRNDSLGERCVSASSASSGLLSVSQQAGCWPP